MGRKIGLTLLALFLIQQTYNLLMCIDDFEIASWGVVLFVAWVLNMFITGIFAFSGFAFPTQKLLPRSYYKVSNPKGLKKIYATLRVHTFRKFLLATFWRSKERQKEYFNGTKDGMSTLEEQSKKSEFGHLIPFVLINFVGLYLIIIGLFALGLCCILINFIGNFYPIILQRHHRMRIQLIRARQERNK